MVFVIYYQDWGNVSIHGVTTDKKIAEDFCDEMNKEYNGGRTSIDDGLGDIYLYFDYIEMELNKLFEEGISIS